jgi:hypothetical protein
MKKAEACLKTSALLALFLTLYSQILYTDSLSRAFVETRQVELPLPDMPMEKLV